MGLLALIGFMPTKGAGAIGALDYTPDEKKKLAVKSNDWECNSCGFKHGDCLLEADPGNNEPENEAKELAAHIDFKGEAEKAKSGDQKANETNQNETCVSSNVVENVEDVVNVSETNL